MDKISVECTLEEKVSKKGNPYTVLIVQLTPTCQKKVFLEQSEIELLKIKYGYSYED